MKAPSARKTQSRWTSPGFWLAFAGLVVTVRAILIAWLAAMELSTLYDRAVTTPSLVHTKFTELWWVAGASAAISLALAVRGWWRSRRRAPAGKPGSEAVPLPVETGN